jgi:hypothetical protein
VQLRTPAGDLGRGAVRERVRSWSRTTGFVIAVLALGAATLALSGSAHAIDETKTGPLDARGFPTSYTDDTGLSLTICEDGTASCAGATTADLADTTDGEAFYWSAEVPAFETQRGTLRIVMAHEAAFASPNVPLVFDRLRVRGTLTGRGTYTLQTPYGSMKLPAGTVNETDDAPCSLTAGGSCAGHITNFLRAVTAPAGYLGDAASPSRFTGGTVRNELVLRAPNGNVVGRTNRMVIMGKLAPGPQALLSAEAVDFGNVPRTRQRTVVVRNLGDQPLSVSSVRLAGGRGLSINRTSTCLTGSTVAPRGACRVNLTYRPGTRKQTAGTLVIADNTVKAVHRVPVRAQTAATFSAPRQLSFRPQRVGTESRARRVVVENTGVLPMRIRAVRLASRSFVLGSGQGPVCARGVSLRPGRACAIYVAFTPRTFGPKSASLAVRSNAVNSPGVVRLAGRGR